MEAQAVLAFNLNPKDSPTWPKPTPLGRCCLLTTCGRTRSIVFECVVFLKQVHLLEQVVIVKFIKACLLSVAKRSWGSRFLD